MGYIPLHEIRRSQITQNETNKYVTILDNMYSKNIVFESSIAISPRSINDLIHIVAIEHQDDTITYHIAQSKLITDLEDNHPNLSKEDIVMLNVYNVLSLYVELKYLHDYQFKFRINTDSNDLNTILTINWDNTSNKELDDALDKSIVDAQQNQMLYGQPMSMSPTAQINDTSIENQITIMMQQKQMRQSDITNPVKRTQVLLDIIDDGLSAIN